MNEKNENGNERDDGKPAAVGRGHRPTRHGFWFGITVGVLSGLLIGGVLATVTKTSYAATFPHGTLSGLGHGHSRGHGAGLDDPELARERAEFVVSWILGRVDATEAQQDEANRIVSETIGDLVPLVQEHRANRETLHAELGREILDESVLERVRSSEVALVDRASKELMEALVQFAAVLTPEQRAELHEMARRFHRR